MGIISHPSTKQYSPYNMQSHLHPTSSLADGVVRAAAFDTRPPSPPYIHIPSPLIDNTHPSLTLTPSYDSIDTGMLTAEDLDIITGGRSQKATDMHQNDWRYEDRRKAQPVLDFLYLGPLSVVRDRAFLQREGITMLLAARDTSMAQIQMMSVDRAASELSIEAAYVDVASRQELIRSFPAAVAKINDHLLRVYKSQAQGTQQTQEGQRIAIDRSTFKRGKVLVFCETGNERSAAIVAAYLMAMYGRDMISAIQFIGAQRFCSNFNEETKYILRSFGDILEAKRMTLRAVNHQGSTTGQQKNGSSYTATSAPIMISSAKKRGIEDTMDEDENSEFAIDMDRYEDRPAFVPYVQGETDTLMD